MTDTERLDYMFHHQAYIGYSKDGESCRVFVKDFGEDDVPPCGWNNFYDNPRKAIDAAMALNRITLPKGVT